MKLKRFCSQSYKQLKIRKIFRSKILELIINVESQEDNNTFKTGDGALWQNSK